MNNTRYLLLAAILVTIGVTGFFTFYEHYEEEVDLGWRSDALLNPFLAAEFYLSKSGYDINSFDSISKIENLSNVDTLFMSNSYQILTDNRQEILLAWLNQGGHLIVAPGSVNTEENDRILSHFNVGIEKSNYVSYNINIIFDDDFLSESISQDGSADDSSEREQRRERIRKVLETANRAIEDLDKQQDFTTEEKRLAYEQSTPAAELTQLSFSDNNQNLRVHFDPSLRLTYLSIEEDSELPDPDYFPFYWRGTEWGTHFIQIDVGDGLLTVISDASIFSSDNIDRFDHAYLLNNLIDENDRSVIIYGANMQSLGQILKEFTPEFFISLGIFTLAWIWFNAPRFGPLQVIEKTTRRSMAEHLHASANYLWQGAFYEDLLEPLCKEIHLKAARMIPSYSALSETAQFENLSQISDIELHQVQAAFAFKQELSEENLLINVQTLQRIRNSL